MKHAFPLRSIAVCIGMLILILDSKTALLGARSGMDLILNTVIPALFPFFFLTILLIGTSETARLPILQPIGVLFRIPETLSFLLIPAFLGGYPTGAQAIACAWKQGSLSTESAQRLLGFCNNAGPSFLFGILASFFPEWWMCWALWGLHILGAMTAAWLIPDCPKSTATPKSPSSVKSISEVLKQSVYVMGSVCGWLLLFRVILAFLEKWVFWYFPDWLRVCLSGMLELTNGCCLLDQIADTKIRFIICSIMLSFGGICVFMQTKSVIFDLSLRWYFLGKLIQALISTCMAVSILYRTWIPLIPLVLVGIPLLKHKKCVAFRGELVYNGLKEIREDDEHAVSQKNPTSLLVLRLRNAAGRRLNPLY